MYNELKQRINISYSLSLQIKCTLAIIMLFLEVLNLCQQTVKPRVSLDSQSGTDITYVMYTALISHLYYCALKQGNYINRHFYSLITDKLHKNFDESHQWWLRLNSQLYTEVYYSVNKIICTYLHKVYTLQFKSVTQRLHSIVQFKSATKRIYSIVEFKSNLTIYVNYCTV